MISAWWLLGAFFLGGYVGIVLMALMSMARAADPDEAAARKGEFQPSTSGHAPPSALDWVI